MSSRSRGSARTGTGSGGKPCSSGGKVGSGDGGIHRSPGAGSVGLAGRRRLLLGLVLALAGIWLAARSALILLPWPALDDFLSRPYSTRCYDRHGQLLQVLPLEDGLRREWYDLEEIPPRLLEVFLAAEDQRFYRHHGVDLAAIVRAAAQNLQEGRQVSGASTVTMQLARLVDRRPAGEKITLGRKIWEAALAIRLELKLSKDAILELYLNSLPFGAQAEGIGSAARTYFGCTPKELTDAQIHLLAIIPRRPATYHPARPENSFEAACLLGQATGFSASREAWHESVFREKLYSSPQRLPHFILYVKNLFSAENFSAGLVPAPKLPPELHLSVDAALTEAVENLVNTKLAEHEAARLSHGAVFAMDNATGEIICWSGGDFWSEQAGQVDGVLVKNQSGSTMKPFIYAMALENGFAPATVLADIPMDFGQEEVYVPLNFNNRFNGPVLFRTALASSLNIPAVYLLYRLGVDSYLSVLADLGVKSFGQIRGEQGLSLALGSGELTLQELVGSFSVFPRGGVAGRSTPFVQSPPTQEPNQQNTAGSDKPVQAVFGEADGSRVFSADTAAIICDILSDQRARALGFGFTQVFNTPYPAIFKTGTSNQFQNIVALGATPRYSVGVWMGNHSGETVIQQTGSSLPATVVRFLLDELTERAAGDDAARHYHPSDKMAFPQDFPQPKNFQKTHVCALSGMKPTEHCPSVTEEYVAVALGNSAGGKGLAFCDWHYSAEDLFGGKQFNSITAVSIRYPQEYQRWLQGKTTPSSFFDTAPLAILYPQPGAVFLFDQGIPPSAQKIRVEATGSGKAAELFVNGKSLGASAAPFSWLVPLELGTMSLKVVLDSGESVTHRIQVK